MVSSYSRVCAFRLAMSRHIRASAATLPESALPGLVSSSTTVKWLAPGTSRYSQARPARLQAATISRLCRRNSALSAPPTAATSVRPLGGGGQNRGLAALPIAPVDVDGQRRLGVASKVEIVAMALSRTIGLVEIGARGRAIGSGGRLPARVDLHVLGHAPAIVVFGLVVQPDLLGIDIP